MNRSDSQGSQDIIDIDLGYKMTTIPSKYLSPGDKKILSQQDKPTVSPIFLEDQNGNNKKNNNYGKWVLGFIIIAGVFLLICILLSNSPCMKDNFRGRGRGGRGRGGRGRGHRGRHWRRRHWPYWRGRWRPYRRFLPYNYPLYTYYGYPYGYPYGSFRSLANCRDTCGYYYSPKYFPNKYEQCLVNCQLGVYA